MRLLGVVAIVRVQLGMAFGRYIREMSTEMRRNKRLRVVRFIDDALRLDWLLDRPVAAHAGSRRASAALSGSDIAWCGQAEPALRAAWARSGRLKKDGPWTTRDAVETAIAFAIPDGVHATKVWDTIKPAVQNLVLNGKEDNIWIVVAQTGGEHRAVAGAAEAGRAAAESGVPCRVLDARTVVKEAKRRYTLKAGAQTAVVRPLRTVATRSRGG